MLKQTKQKFQQQQQQQQYDANFSIVSGLASSGSTLANKLTNENISKRLTSDCGYETANRNNNM